jgi:hypothetical protein
VGTAAGVVSRATPLPSASSYVDPSALALRRLGQLGWRLASAASVLLIASHSFYFYKIGFPVVPIAGAALLFVIAPFYPRDRVARGRRLNPLTLLQWGATALLVLLSGVVAVMIGHRASLKAPFGFLLGMTTLLVILRGRWSTSWRRHLYAALTIAGVVHLVGFYGQLGYFLTTGTLLDFIYPITGEKSRHAYFALVKLPRCGGFFIEPATYSTFAFMVLTVRLAARRGAFGLLETLLALSTLLSLSIIGMFLGGIALLSCVSRLRSALWAIAFASGLIASVLSIDQLAPVREYIAQRVSAPLVDPSGRDRLIDGAMLYAKESTSRLLFGYGLGSEEEIMAREGDAGGNGVIYLAYYFGIIGAVMFVTLWWAILRRERMSARAFMLVAAVMLGAPPYTHVVFWLWLGLLCLGVQLSEDQQMVSRRAPRSEWPEPMECSRVGDGALRLSLRQGLGGGFRCTVVTRKAVAL